MKVDIYTTKGKKKSTKATVSDAVFAASKNDSLVHQVVVSMQANARCTIAHTKDRSDVRGGGKKPWKQKGTGRARVGSSRSPIWRGGGVTFGPTNERNFSKKINSKMRARALYATLSEKLTAGQVLFIDKLDIDTPKTAVANVILEVLADIKGFKSLSAKHNAAIIYITEKDENITKSFANFGNIDVKEVRNANPVDILTHKNVIIVDAEAASAVLESRVTKIAKKESKKDVKKPDNKTDK